MPPWILPVVVVWIVPVVIIGICFLRILFLARAKRRGDAKIAPVAEPTIADIPDLLHDASLEGVLFRLKKNEMRMDWHCLGAGDVRLVFRGVCVVICRLEFAATIWDRPWWANMRNPEWEEALPEPKPPRAPDIARFKRRIRGPYHGTHPYDVDIQINADAAQREMLDAPDAYILSGEKEMVASCPVRVTFRLYGDFLGQDDYNVQFLIGCERVEAYRGGRRLSLSVWDRDFRWWWKAWEEHWREKSRRAAEGDEDTDAPSPFDAAIPAGGFDEEEDEPKE